MWKVILLFFLLITNLFADKNLYKLEKPLNIASEEALFNQNEGTITFEKNVIVKNDDFKLQSDILEITYKKDNKNNKDLIDKIVAKNNTKLYSSDIRADGNIGIFDTKKYTITLIENVYIKNDKLNIKTDKFIYDIKTKKTIINSKKDNKITLILE